MIIWTFDYGKNVGPIDLGVDTPDIVRARLRNAGWVQLIDSPTMYIDAFRFTEEGIMLTVSYDPTNNTARVVMWNGNGIRLILPDKHRVPYTYKEVLSTYEDIQSMPLCVGVPWIGSKTHDIAFNITTPEAIPLPNNDYAVLGTIVARKGFFNSLDTTK